MNNEQKNTKKKCSDLRLRFMVLDVIFVFLIVVRDCFSVGVSFGLFSFLALVCGVFLIEKNVFY